MNEIFVTNYFTKEKISPEKSMEELEEECVNDIGDILKENEKNKNYRELGDKISEALSSLPIDSVPEYTILPVSSLLGHLKTTAAIAVALAIDRGFSSEVDKIRVSALLHDIGKLRVFSIIEKGKKPSFKDHVKYTEEILRKAGDRGISNSSSPLGEFWQRVISIAPRHHTPDYYERYQANTDLHRIVADADTIASAANRIGDLSIGDYGKVENNSPFPHIAIIGGEPHCLFPQESLEVDNEEKNIEVPTLHGVLMESWGGTNIQNQLGLLYMDIHGIQRFIGESKKLPEISGASYIIENEIAERAKEIVSRHLSADNIVYIGGGNMLAITPSNENILQEIERELAAMVSDASRGGLKATVGHELFDIARISSAFGSCVGDLIEKLKEGEQSPPEPEISVSRSSELCQHCGSRRATREIRGDRVCEVCFNKYEYGKKIPGPKDLSEIGDNIAVVIADGNMMGRLFASSRTPTDYAFKSHFVKLKMKGIVNSVLPENSRTLYVGGDDIMFIVDAKEALPVTKKLIDKISEEFRYQPEYSECVGGPIITISAGISIADHKFPIYFLIEKAKKLETQSKKEFRKNVKRVQNSSGNGFFVLPEGSLSFSVVTSSMPSERNFSFVFPSDIEEFRIIEKFISRVTGEKRDSWRSLVSLIINNGTSVEERLNLIKFLYSKIEKKDIISKAASSEGLEPMSVMEEVTHVLMEDELLNSIMDMVPTVWHERRD